MSDTKLISEYLAAAGVTAISVVKERKGYGIVVGRAAVTTEGVTSIFWAEKKFAAKIARAVRTFTPTDRATVERELVRMASYFGARLTPNNVVMSRATDAAKRLEAYLSNMNEIGGLSDFNKEYKRRRKNAVARGEKFISFSTATKRLRRVLIKMLIDKQQLRASPTFFDVVFE